MARSLHPMARGVVALGVLLGLAACDRGGGGADRSATAVDQGARDGTPMEGPTTPRWVYRDPQHPNPVAVVFVHGLFGDTIGTWRNASGRTMLDYLHDAPDIGDKVDVYAFGFTSLKAGQGSLKVGEAANKLDDYLVRDGVARYPQIVFVAHSMGGLVTLRTMIQHPEIAAKTPLLVFYATPHEGAEVTRIAQVIFNNNAAVKQMLPVDTNDYLQQLNEDWMRVRTLTPRPALVCAYETRPTDGVSIVPWSSGTRNCDEDSGIENSDHITIVKPVGPSAHAMVVLEKALQQHVLPNIDATAWDTPGIRDEQPGHWAYTLVRFADFNPVHIVNRSAIAQRYSLTSSDTETLLVTPDATSRSLAPGTEDVVGLVPIGDVQPAYAFHLRLGATTDRDVTARFADLDAAIAARNAKTNAVAEHMNAYLASDDNAAQLRALPPDEQNATLARLADEAIGQQAPKLPEGARLLVAADALRMLNLSNSAAAALATLQERDPATAQSASARHLAGVVAARTGKTDVLGPIAVPAVPEAEAVKPADLQATSAAQRDTLGTLADHLQTVPATQAEATVLRGDVLQASGDTAAAARAYSEAAAVGSTPVVRDRLQRVEAVHH